MLTLGIDPGTATIGYGVVRELHDGSLQSVAYGAVTTPAGLPLATRLEMIFDGITKLVKEYQPDRSAVEELFFAKNVTTAISVAHGRGVILLALSQANLPVFEYQPPIIKQSVAGYGNAKKPQVQEMVRILLGLEKIPRPDDAADALAVAITDIHNAHYSALE